MSNYLYAIVDKKNGYIIDVAYSRDSARSIKRMYEAEYAGKYIINQMAVSKRVR